MSGVQKELTIESWNRAHIPVLDILTNLKNPFWPRQFKFKPLEEHILIFFYSSGSMGVVRISKENARSLIGIDTL